MTWTPIAFCRHCRARTRHAMRGKIVVCLSCSPPRDGDDGRSTSRAEQLELGGLATPAPRGVVEREAPARWTACGYSGGRTGGAR